MQTRTLCPGVVELCQVVAAPKGYCIGSAVRLCVMGLYGLCFE